MEMGTALLGSIPLRIAELAAEGNNLTLCLGEGRGLKAEIEKGGENMEEKLGTSCIGQVRQASFKVV